MSLEVLHVGAEKSYESQSPRVPLRCRSLQRAKTVDPGNYSGVHEFDVWREWSVVLLKSLNPEASECQSSTFWLASSSNQRSHEIFDKEKGLEPKFDNKGKRGA
jgi:hypothetical protein